MATIGEISQGSQYQGNPALGGAIGVGVAIDPSPLQRLATFTYYRDRDLWEKKQKEDALAAEKIAMMTAFDINSPLKPYAEDLKKGLDEYQTYVRDNPDSLTYSRSPEKFQKREEILGRLVNKRKRATVNDVLYNRDKSAAELEPNAAKRQAKLELLDINANDLFVNGVDDAYNKQYRSAAEIKPDDYNIGKIPTTDIFTITRNANDTEIKGKTYGDMDRLDALIEGEYLGLAKESVANTPEFQQMNESEKKRALAEEKIRTGSLRGLDNTATVVNSLVKQFTDKLGENINVDQIPESELSKAGSVGGYIRLAKKFNQQVREINSDTGRAFAEINVVDGASPTELMKLEWFGANGETLSKEIKPTVQQTDNDLQKQRLNAEWMRIGLAKSQLDKVNQEDLFGADAVLRQVANSINKGESEAVTTIKIPGLEWSTDIKGPKKDVFLITDLTTLKNFARIDKDGTQYNAPNAVEYNKKLGQLNIIYFKQGSDGSIQTDDNDKPVVDATKTQKIDEREWLFTKVKEAFPNKDAGGINSIISQALLKNKNSLYNIAQLYKDPSATSQAPDVMINKGGSTGSKTKYTLGGKTYSPADVEAAAKASNMSVSDYIKKAGLQ